MNAYLFLAALLLVAVWSSTWLNAYLKAVFHKRNLRKMWDLATKQAAEYVANVKAQYPGCEGARADATTTDIFSKCIPALTTNIRQCGLMTVCDAVVPKPEELDTIFKDGEGNYRIMEAMFQHQMEMKFCAVRQYNMFDYFMANKVDLSKKLSSEQINSGLLNIRPYILVKRKAPYYNNYWQFESGAACLVNGTLDGGGTYWRIDAFSPTGIPADTQWFNQKERLFAKGKTNGGSATNTAWQVESCTLVTVNGVPRLRIVLANQNLNSFLDAENLTKPVNGLLVRGTANVSDYESFCARPPGLITNNMDEFWIETTRDAQCIDQMYIKWRDLVMANNPLYAQWNDLSPIEYNKQSGEDFQRRWVNTVFFNKALENQTISTVEDLDNIETVEPGGARCIGKRANAIGIYEQHAQHKRIVDLQGAQLNLPALFEALYTMQRLREDIGSATDVFELAIPSQFYSAFNQAMLAYYKDQANGNLQLFQDVSKGGVKVAPLGFKYMDYPLIYPSCTLRIVMDRFFDDYLAAHEDAGLEDVGRLMWIIDWSKIYVGIFASNRVVNNTNDLKTMAAVDPTYRCVMAIPTATTTLMSFTWTVICEAPQANLIIENFSDEVPEPTDLDGDYNGTCNTTTTTTTTSTTTTTTSTTTTTTAP